MQNFSFKGVLLTILIMIVPVFAVAQSAMQDVIYLKNGSILRGEIIEHEDKETIKIEVAGFNILVVQRDEIEKIDQEPKPEPQLYKKSGYVIMTGVMYAPGELGNSVQFYMINGHQINPKFSLGVGFGYTIYNEPLNAVPLFLGLKYKFFERNSTPFAYVRAGYNFSVKSNSNQQNQRNSAMEDHSGGTLLTMGIGAHFDISERIAWYLTWGFSADNLSYTEMFGFQKVKTELNYRRIALSFGFSF